MEAFGRRKLLKMAAGTAAVAASALFLKDRAESAPPVVERGEIVSVEYNGHSERFLSAWDFAKEGESSQITFISTPMEPDTIFYDLRGSFPQYDRNWKIERADNVKAVSDYEWMP